MARLRITASALESLQPGGIIYDDVVIGLGARRQTAGGDVTFFFKAKITGTQKQVFVTIGKWRRGDWTIAEARTRATELRHDVKRGIDPMAEKRALREVMTVNELCDAYLAALPTLLISREGRAKRESTVATDRSRIDSHIRPLLGAKPVTEVTLADIETFMHRVAAGETGRPRRRGKGVGRGSAPAGGRGTAARTVGLLGGIFAYAVKRNLRPDNPCRGVVRFADQRRDRRLSADEYRLFGLGLYEISVEYPVAAACIRFLALTGWRRGEAVKLCWSDIDAARRTATLGDTKTGRSIRPLAHAALDIITSMHRLAGTDFVFPSSHAGRPIGSISTAWRKMIVAAGLPADITPHTLRHSAASLASDLGLSEATIAGLLGHKLGTITSRYVHAADATLLAAADRVADSVLEAMGEVKADSTVVQMRPG